MVVGDRVIADSDDIDAIPAPEELLRLGESDGLVAYCFTAEMIEEASG